MPPRKIGTRANLDLRTREAITRTIGTRNTVKRKMRIMLNRMTPCMKRRRKHMMLRDLR